MDVNAVAVCSVAKDFHKYKLLANMIFQDIKC